MPFVDRRIASNSIYLEIAVNIGLLRAPGGVSPLEVVDAKCQHVPRKPNSSPQAHAILATLSVAPDRWCYGYELCKLTGVKSGTLYPLLIRLHDQGFLQSEWRPPEAIGRPPRHAYRLTNEGRRLAASVAADYNRQSLRTRAAGARPA